MKKIAYYALHYGKEYLAHSARSVDPAVDEIHVLYTPTPSFGHGTSAVNPDKREELLDAVNRYSSKPVYWHDGQWGQEGQHRDAIIGIARKSGADLVVAVDADEVWHTESLAACFRWLESQPKAGVSRYRAHFLHFWRSFGFVCRDPLWPERFIDLRPAASGGSVDYIPREVQLHPVYHFGYAQSEALMRYKWQIHGHQNELRPGWLEQKFIGWNPGVGDVHPTNLNFWNPEVTDDVTRAVVDSLLGDHPYHGLGLIQ